MPRDTRRRDLYPGEVFIYLTAPSLGVRVGELRYVAGPGVRAPEWCTAQPSPRAGRHVTEAGMGAKVIRVTPGDNWADPV
jgi:hypothetical protein